LNPGPLPLGPGIETRPTDRSQKAADMPRFWLGRSVAGRLLIRNHRKSGGERYPPKKDALVACGARPYRLPEKLPPKKTQLIANIDGFRKTLPEGMNSESEG